MKAAIVGIDGPELMRDEAALFEALPPAGVILFARNIKDPAQLARLVGDLREAMPAGARMMVDQEGGRVARLRPPGWTAQPAAGLVGAVAAEDPAAGLRLAWLTGALIGLECREAGFDVVCAPVLDLLHDETTGAIGDRAYGSDPARVGALAQSMADGLLSAGVQPVGKHAPGHGRARVDSHAALPFVDATTDLTPDIAVFKQCNSLPWMMTAHILFAGLDPERPATLSRRVIAQTIRGTIGFDGVLVSDDLAMSALSGDPGSRARDSVAAGCDLALHCSGRLADSEAVLGAVPELAAAARGRLARAASLAARSRLSLNHDTLVADQAALLAGVVAA